MDDQTDRAATQPTKGDTSVEKQTIGQVYVSSSIYERLEEFLREEVQRFIQAFLEEEVTALWGCVKSA